ncbi:GldG family protein [Paenibacillus sp. FJAT-26967]|uniref:GldG family protein n=1 Tax=Paenibacillus sp. FJAT-26967 TaxID=1729690 RepID=UPI000838F137|nr:GldG family protein [Paenibacillus sp. FJAT-26967]
MKKLLRGTNTAVLTVAVIGIFILLTFFLHSLKDFQLDLSKNKMYTLSEQTIGTLQGLDQDIQITAFTNPMEDSEGVLTREVTDMVQEYTKRNNKITFKQYDMLKEPSKAQQYGVQQSSVIFESGDQKKVVSFSEMFTGGAGDGSYQFTGEEKMTQALKSLTSKEKHTVYFLSGHQEITLQEMTALKSSLEGENYTVQELNLYREGKIPDDAEMLLLIGPQTDLNDKETELIKQYLDGKGKIYVALGFSKDMATSWKNIDAIMNTYGIKDQHAVAIETKQSTLYDPLTLIPEYGTHAITSKLSQYNLLTMMSLTVALNAEDKEGFTSTPLIRSTAGAYGETDIAGLMQSKTDKDDKDVPGPLNLGYAVEDKEGKPKAVLLGGSTFLMDGEITVQGNRDFAMNSIGWLQEKKDQVTIRPRQNEAYQTAALTPGQAQIIFLGAVVIFPLLFLLLGGFIWWRRRKG